MSGFLYIWIVRHLACRKAEIIEQKFTKIEHIYIYKLKKKVFWFHASFLKIVIYISYKIVYFNGLIEICKDWYSIFHNCI